MRKVIVYIDGFNFFYGLKKVQSWKKYYWIDLVKLFNMFMREDQELTAVKYFSAVPDDIGKSKRQDAFFQVNKENSKFNLILGKYLKKEITCKNCNYIIHTHEEKESDVRIATQIVVDAYQKNCDVSIVVSADSDMSPVIEIMKEIGHPLYVYFPPNQYSNNLISISSYKVIKLQQYEQRFKKCILPDVIHLKNGFNLNIPLKWKEFQTK